MPSDIALSPKIAPNIPKINTNSDASLSRAELKSMLDNLNKAEASGKTLTPDQTALKTDLQQYFKLAEFEGKSDADITAAAAGGKIESDIKTQADVNKAMGKYQSTLEDRLSGEDDEVFLNDLNALVANLDGATATPLAVPDAPAVDTSAATLSKDGKEKVGVLAKEVDSEIKGLEKDKAAATTDPEKAALQSKIDVLSAYRGNLDSVAKLPPEATAANVPALTLDKTALAASGYKEADLNALRDTALAGTAISKDDFVSKLGSTPERAEAHAKNLGTPPAAVAGAPAPSAKPKEAPLGPPVEGLTDDVLAAAKGEQLSTSNSSGRIYNVDGRRYLINRSGETGWEVTKDGLKPMKHVPGETEGKGHWVYSGEKTLNVEKGHSATIWTDNDHLPVAGQPVGPDNCPESGMIMSRDENDNLFVSFTESKDDPNTPGDERVFVNMNKFQVGADNRLTEVPLSDAELSVVEKGRLAFAESREGSKQYGFLDNGGIWDLSDKKFVEGSPAWGSTGGTLPGSSAHEFTGMSDIYRGMAESMQQKALLDLQKSKKQRALDQLLAAMAGGGGGGGGIGGGGFGGGPEFGFGGPGFGGGGDGGWSLGTNVGFGNGDYAAHVGVGVDSNGNFGINGGYQDQNFGFNVGFNNGFPGQYCGIPQSFGCCGTIVDFETLLLMVVTILEEQERENIAGILKKMNSLSNQQKGVSANDLKNSPGQLQGLSTDSAILQTQLTMAVQKRQRLLEMLDNAIKSANDAKMNSIRRMV